MYYDIPEGVDDFFSNLGLPVEKIIRLGEKRGIDQGCVERGLVEVYGRVQGGEFIKTVAIVPRVLSAGGDPGGRVIDSGRVQLLIDERAALRVLLRDRDEEWSSSIQICVFCIVMSAVPVFSVWRFLWNF